MTVPRRCFFCGSILLFVVRVILSCQFLAALWSPVGKGLTLWLSCMWSFLVFFPLFHMMSLVRCGIWLYGFLIFAFFLTLYFCSRWSAMVTTPIVILICRDFKTKQNLNITYQTYQVRYIKECNYIHTRTHVRTSKISKLIIDFELKKVLLPPHPPREFCRHILSWRKFQAASFKRCLHSVLRGVSLWQPVTYVTVTN